MKFETNVKITYATSILLEKLSVLFCGFFHAVSWFEIVHALYIDFHVYTMCDFQILYKHMKVCHYFCHRVEIYYNLIYIKIDR